MSQNLFNKSEFVVDLCGLNDEASMLKENLESIFSIKNQRCKCKYLMQFSMKKEIFSNFTILSCSFIETWLNLVIIRFFNFSFSCDVNDVNLRRLKLDFEKWMMIEIIDIDVDFVIIIEFDKNLINIKNRWNDLINIENFLIKFVDWHN
jgi:hypothetical protein